MLYLSRGASQCGQDGAAFGATASTAPREYPRRRARRRPRHAQSRQNSLCAVADVCAASSAVASHVDWRVYDSVLSGVYPTARHQEGISHHCVADTMTTITLTQLHCVRCDHRWFPRTRTLPRRCPGCLNARWDRPYVRGPKAKKDFSESA